MRETQDLMIPLSRGQVKVRHYIPENAALASAACCIYFHGGGFVLGDVDEYDTLTQHLAANSGCHVLSVDYELAPASKVNKSIRTVLRSIAGFANTGLTSELTRTGLRWPETAPVVILPQP